MKLLLCLFVCFFYFFYIAVLFFFISLVGIFFFNFSRVVISSRFIYLLSVQTTYLMHSLFDTAFIPFVFFFYFFYLDVFFCFINHLVGILFFSIYLTLQFRHVSSTYFLFQLYAFTSSHTYPSIFHFQGHLQPSIYYNHQSTVLEGYLQPSF